MKATWRDWQVTENEYFCWLESIKQISPCNWLWPRNARQEETAWPICNEIKQFFVFFRRYLTCKCNVMIMSWRKILAYLYIVGTTEILTVFHFKSLYYNWSNAVFIIADSEQTEERVVEWLTLRETSALSAEETDLLDVWLNHFYRQAINVS